MRYLLPLLFLAALPAFAELGFQDLEAKRSEWETYRFPLLLGDSPAVRRINTYLHSVELEGLPGRFERSPFENVWPKQGEFHGVNSLDYQIDAQTPGYLSLSISGEYTGAYSSLGSRSYNFDLHDGQPLGLQQLFSVEGLERLRRRVAQARVERIEAFLAGQEVPSGHGGEPVRLRQEDAEAAALQREIYENCLGLKRESDLDYDDLQLLADALVLTAGECAPHVVRALDDLGSYVNRFPYSELQADFSAYGRCLLLERRTDCRRSYDELWPGVYQGRLGGRYPITLVIERVHSDGSFSAVYYYDRYAKRIALGSGQSAERTLRLSEHGEPPAHFELRLADDGSLKGTWQQRGGTPLPVELGR